MTKEAATGSPWVDADGTITAPPQFDFQHSRRWLDRDAAECYQYRFTYPPETFEVLASLLADVLPVALDIGCGTGNIARYLAPAVARIDAIDLSAAMVEVGKGLPGGDDPKIRWQVASAENAELSPPYALVVGGASLHWMAWHVVLPRFAEALTPNGKLVIATLQVAAPQPWTSQLTEIVDRYSTYQEYIPFDMLPAWEQAGLFRPEGQHVTAPVVETRTIEEYILGWHAASNLTRRHIDADAFDAEVRVLLEAHCPDGLVKTPVSAQLEWGRPQVERPPRR